MIVAHSYSQLYFLDGFSLMDIIAVHSESQSHPTIGGCATRQDMKLCYKLARVGKFP